MSLNGLDDPKIKAAHDAAVAEPGGWFLLRYASRDDVELAGCGNGGIVEIRNAIANFEVEEPAPLYGFLRYRRRNVVISYVPEECSRLVQARVTVHLTAVTERFSPHDTEFPITTARELRDTSLSAACSLHTASGSTSSSTSSLRRRRLVEIAEDAEEENRAKRQSTVPEERPSTEKTDALPSPPSLSPELPTAVPESTSFNSMISETGSYSSPGKEAHDADMGSRFPATERRESSHPTRSDPYSSSSYGSSGVRPKVKLGPRPSIDAAAVGGRPHTSGSASFRPVATLPVGIKMVSRGSRKEKEREKHPGDPPTMTISPPPMGDAMLAPGQYDSTRPHTSGGRSTSRSEPLPSPTVLSPTSVSAPKTPTIKPEKARLMKALELRKKKKLDAVTFPEQTYPCSPDGLVSPVSIGDGTSTGALKEADDTLASLDQLVKADDSGISFDASSAVRTDESDATRSDSYPVSPVGPSEMAESTKASSISESTDETVLEHTNVKEEPRINEETETSSPSHDETTAITNIVNGTSLLEAPEEHLEHLSPAVHNPSHEYVRITASDTPEAEPMGTLEKQAYPEADPVCEPASQPSESPEIEASGASSNELPILQDEKTEAAPDSASAKMLSEASARDAEGICETSLLNNDAEVVAPEESPVGSTFSAGSEDIFGIKKPRLKGCMEPIRTDVKVASHSRSNSETQFLSDDDFMDELSSAVVQEAQPMSVSKSPVGSPFPSSKKQNSEQSRFSRLFSTPLRKEKTDSSMLEPPSDEQRPPSSRSVSAGAASYLNHISQQQNSPLAKKVNLGSGISQRIKALEKLSSLAPGDGAPTTGPAQGASTAFFSVRKANARGKSPTIAERANSLTLNSPGFSLESSPSPSPDGGRMDTFTSAVVSSTPPTGSQPESISVTARIVRDPSQPFPAMSEAGKDPSEYAPLDLKQSLLVIDHQRAVAQPPRETHLEPRISEEERLSSSKLTIANERRSSATIIKDLISEGRRSLSERRRSTNIEHSVTIPSVRSSSRRSSISTSPTKQRPLSFNSRVSTSSRRDHGKSLSPPPTAGSSSSTGTASDEKFDKKSNRASKMMRRMSSSLSASRKTLAHAISPTVREESEPLSLGDDHTLAPSPMSSTGFDIGDVNVQFPDSLLWKRRSMLLDSQGFLIISPALSAHGNGRDKSNAGATRRFHLSEFRPPCIPDVEMQELPNSVVLDFIDGGGLQVACEDRYGQGRILETLEEAHRSWEAYGNE